MATGPLAPDDPEAGHEDCLASVKFWRRTPKGEPLAGVNGDGSPHPEQEAGHAALGFSSLKLLPPSDPAAQLRLASAPPTHRAAVIKVLMAFLCMCVVIAGLCLFGIYTTRALAKTSTILAALGMRFEYLHHLIHVMWISIIVGIVILTAVLFTLAVLRALMSFKVYSNLPQYNAARSTAFVSASFIFGFLTWLATLLLIATACGYTIWAGLNIGLYIVSGKATNAVAAQFDRAHAKMADIDALFDSYTLADRVGNVSASLRLLLAPKIAAVRADMQPSPAGCASDCLDLSFLGIIKGEKVCMCSLATLNAARPYCKQAAREVILAIVGLLVMWMGSTWMLLGVTASAARCLSERHGAEAPALADDVQGAGGLGSPDGAAALPPKPSLLSVSARSPPPV